MFGSPAWPIGPCPNSALPRQQPTAQGSAKKASVSACVSLPLSLLVTLQGRDSSNAQERSQNFQLGFSRCVLCPLQSDLSVFQLTVAVGFHPQKGQWMQMSCGCPWIGEMALGSSAKKLFFFAPKKYLGKSMDKGQHPPFLHPCFSQFKGRKILSPSVSGKLNVFREMCY